ncbi:MAG: exodeoxyribonuclease VII small subunit [Clostridia bacterium]|nr:exodeoxyribonuclease VII small subunit [Clostridia bacterium]
MEIEEMSYEQAFSRLEEITAAMGEAATPLDKLMSLYEEGMALAARCESLLKGYEARLEKVSKAVLERTMEEAPDETDDGEAPF